MTKSLSLTLACMSLAQGSRTTASVADGAPLAGTQMIQVKKARTNWQMTFTDAKHTCSTEGVVSWHVRAETEDDCKNACEASDKPCSAGFFFMNHAGNPDCQLFETCESCHNTQYAGNTFQADGNACSATCTWKVCKEEPGWKPKHGYADVTCAGPECNLDECCIPPSTTTTTQPPTPGPSKCDDPGRSRWCGHPCSRFSRQDCDLDGFLDLVCDDCHGGSWIKLSAQCSPDNTTTNCADMAREAAMAKLPLAPPPAPSTCDDPGRQRWCGHKGSHFSWKDCDIDGFLDMVCEDDVGWSWIRLSADCSNGGPKDITTKKCAEMVKEHR